VHFSDLKSLSAAADILPVHPPVQESPVVDDPSHSSAEGTAEGIDAFLDVVLDVRVELGRTRITVERAMKLQEGSVIELNNMAGDPLDVVVNGRLVARGEAVVVGERLGVRIIEVIPTDRGRGRLTRRDNEPALPPAGTSGRS
jgi:flagellar motor switch protein FliN/FliY